MSPSPEEGLTRQGLEALYVRLERPLYNVVYRWVWDADEALDLVQEAFLRLWRTRARVRAGTVEPLVYRIAVNLASNRRRSRRLWRWVGLEAASSAHCRGPDAADRVEERQLREGVRRAVDALPERLRRVVVLTELAELSYADVARILGIPEGTVASRRHAAVRRLRELLGSDMES